MSDDVWYRRDADEGWVAERTRSALPFHESLPGYARTRLVEVPRLAADAGVGRVFVKEESSRLGLPAFKILGASYAIARALSARFGVQDRPLPPAELRERIAEQGGPALYAATDGNHGRAVAHMARLLGLPAHIFVPGTLTDAARDAIAGEGARVTQLEVDYDTLVTIAAESAGDDLLIQDTSWPAYQRIPRWIVDGYSTLFEEADAQLPAPADLVVVPVGVGSLAQAAVGHYRAGGRSHRPNVLSVEAENAPAIISSLRAGEPVSVQTSHTVMAGLNCGTPSGDAWPWLRDGLDAAVTVSDEQTARAVGELQDLGVDSGPCGAATLAALQRISPTELGLNDSSVILLVSTEGRSANPLPAPGKQAP